MRTTDVIVTSLLVLLWSVEARHRPLPKEVAMHQRPINLEGMKLKTQDGMVTIKLGTDSKEIVESLPGMKTMTTGAPVPHGSSSGGGRVEIGLRDGLKAPSPQSVAESSKVTLLPPVFANHTGIGPKSNHFVQQQRGGVPCGTSYTLSSGESKTIQSKNYPSRYPNRHRCSWSFQLASSADTLTLTCQQFRLQYSRKCWRDSLKIIYGGKKRKYCGWRGPRSIQTKRVLIYFKTDRRRNNWGFSCTVSAISPPTTPTAATTAAAAATTTKAALTTTTAAALTPTTAASLTTTTAAALTTTTTAAALTTTTPAFSCRCGIPNRSSRIVGGTETEVNEYPWQVALVDGVRYTVYCGGSIISDQWILTAAHCAIVTIVGVDLVLVGDHDYANPNEVIAYLVHISQIINHPNYDGKLNHDAALLKLSTQLTWREDNTVAPVCLPLVSSQLYENVEATVTGWGAQYQGGGSRSQLYEVTVPTMSNSQCRNSYSDIYDNMICAGFPMGGKDSCNGDSGGPLVYMSEGNYEEIGIVSWGNGCAKPGFPGVYARVTYFLSWIQSNTAGSDFCPR